MFEYYNTDIPDNMILMGDTTLDRRIDVSDATLVQKHIVRFENLTNNSLVAADVDRDNTISIKDATLIQCYVVKFENCGYCGTYVDPSQLPTVPATEPTTETPATEPVTEPSTEVTTAPGTEPTVPTTQPQRLLPQPNRQQSASHMFMQRAIPMHTSGTVMQPIWQVNGREKQWKVSVMVSTV